MSKRQILKKVLIAAVIILLGVCHAHDRPSVMPINHQLADRIISMAYIMHHDAMFLMRPGDSHIKRLFREVDDLFRKHGQAIHFAGSLPLVSHYCHIELQAGYFCGSRYYPGQSYGYLFASSWIKQNHREFMIVIMSTDAPEHTVIARIENSRAQVIYNSFSTENTCVMKPKSASWVRLHIVHFVKVLSPRRFILVVGSVSAFERSETLRLHVGLSSCAITLLARKSGRPECTAQKPCQSLSHRSEHEWRSVKPRRKRVIVK